MHERLGRNAMKRLGVFTALMALPCMVPVSHSAEPAVPAALTTLSSPAADRALNADQLTAIRRISRDVLVAKKSGREDSEDENALNTLRGALDRLIANDFDPTARAAITVVGQETGEQRRTRERSDRQRDAMRAEVIALADRMRDRGEDRARIARSSPDAETRSAGLPISEQRARLLVRLAEKLDVALSESETARSIRLNELRDQLRPARGIRGDSPPTHGTPTLQVMPAGLASPRSDDSSGERRR
jgi:hypothetical protein